MPDRLPSLILLVGFWVPPAVAGYAAANFVRRSTKHLRPATIYVALVSFALASSLAWFLINVYAMPPYIPGATHDPTYAPPEAVSALAVLSSVFVFPGSVLACVLAFRRRGRTLTRASGARQLV